MSSRYSSVSSSTELRNHKPSLKTAKETHKPKSNDSAIITNTRNEQSFSAMVKKFMEKKSNFSSSSKPNSIKPLFIPPDLIAQDLKKNAKKGSSLSSLPSKIFGRAKSEVKTKALTEVKANTRTLSMVLRSERELLNANKEQECYIVELKSLLHERTSEVEKLKDLCLKQREEIKALKSAILFPDDMNSQLHELLHQQGSELKQANRVIPTLQTQISSLTGQLQCLSEDLAQVKAANSTTRSTDGSFSTPRTRVYDQKEAANSLDFSSDDPIMSDSPENMLLKDVNPCLTPCYSRMKSKEYEGVSYNYSQDGTIYGGNVTARKLSTSSDQFIVSASENETFCRSDETRYRYRKTIARHIL